MPNPSPLSSSQAIVCLVDLIASLHEVAAKLPQGFSNTADSWNRLFQTNDRTRRILEVLCELPAFTESAPARGDAAAWRRLWTRDFQKPGKPAMSVGVGAAEGLVAEIILAANPPAQRPAPKRWRDRFGTGETFQRVRPVESQAYLHNPHRGTATFQRFQGDDLYPGWSWSDTHGPLKFAHGEPLRQNDKYIGYRFAVRQVTLPLEFRPGGAITVDFFIDNVGCAPIYRRYTLALRFRQGDKAHVVPLQADMRTWLPGHTWFEESITTPTDLSDGEVQIDLAIIDAAHRPKVWFALDDLTEDRWHRLAYMDAVKDPTQRGTERAPMA